MRCGHCSNYQCGARRVSHQQTPSPLPLYIYYYTPLPLNLANNKQATSNKQASNKQQATLLLSVLAITSFHRFGLYSTLATSYPWWCPCQIQVLSQKLTGGTPGQGRQVGRCPPKLVHFVPQNSLFWPKMAPKPTPNGQTKGHSCYTPRAPRLPRDKELLVALLTPRYVRETRKYQPAHFLSFNDILPRPHPTPSPPTQLGRGGLARGLYLHPPPSELKTRPTHTSLPPTAQASGEGPGSEPQSPLLAPRPVPYMPLPPLQSQRQAHIRPATSSTTTATGSPWARMRSWSGRSP